MPVLSIESEAFVIDILPCGESHRLVALLTRERGIVRGIARSARKSLRRFPGALDYFNLIEISAHIKSATDELWTLERATIVRHYRTIVTDTKRYLTGCWMIQSCRNLIPPELSDPQFFEWMKNNFDYLEENGPTAASIFFFFIRLMDIMGNLPSFDRCISCGREAPAGKDAYFEPSASGLVCRKCGRGKLLLPGTLRHFFLLAAQTSSASDLTTFPPETILAALRNEKTVFAVVEQLEEATSGRRNPAFSILFRFLLPTASTHSERLKCK